jgi:hypothetical protein
MRIFKHFCLEMRMDIAQSFFNAAPLLPRLRRIERHQLKLAFFVEEPGF